MTCVSKKRSGLDHCHLGRYLFINICSRLDPVAGGPGRRHSWAGFLLVGQPLDFLGNMASFGQESRFSDFFWAKPPSGAKSSSFQAVDGTNEVVSLQNINDNLCGGHHSPPAFWLYRLSCSA